MTSYMYNPSEKVKEILSKFLEFDPSELELGIWSGDLTLKNLKLRQDAIRPLLNKKADKPHSNPLKKAPLHMKLVKGTVGNMRIRIPWKRLVWGQGAVQLEISDVTIVLSLQSREETEEQRRNGLLKTGKRKKQAEDNNGVSDAYREAKQRRLREAERRHLQGMPVALYLDNVHRKNSIERDAAKVEGASKKKKTKKTKEPGRIDKWLKNTGSDLFWRFFAGIQGSITKARIVVVQDGVEVGCIVQSIEVVAGKDGTRFNVNMGGEDPSEGMSEEAMSAAEMTPPANVAYESGYDDGEHVDKTIKQQGLGLFIRKEVSMAKVPQALRFSTSVSANDYILRPVDLDLSFSFFYPYPPDRRKKRAPDNHSQETPTTAASSTGVSGTVSISDSTTNASSKIRRGKREKHGVTPNTIPNIAVLTPVEDRRGSMEQSTSLNRTPNDRQENLASTSSLTRGRMTPRTTTESRLRLGNQRIVSENPNSTTTSHRPQLQRFASAVSGRTGNVSMDHTSVQDSPSIIHDRSLKPVPKFDCRASLKEIRIVFTTRHYELLNYFLSTVARMQNGRPDQMIRSTPKETDTSAFQRKFMDLNDPTNPLCPKSPVFKKSPKFNSTKLTAMLAPLTGFRASMAEDAETDPIESMSEMKNGDPTIPIRRSLRSQVLMKWWKYSIGAILWEVRKRKHLTTNFRQMYISFDWNKQRYKRKEYIELYIAKKLDKRPREGVWRFEDSDNREEELLRIEDELPLEQILLYRSMARSIRVRGMKEMPQSIRDLRATTSTTKKSPRVRGPDQLLDKDGGDTGEGTLLTLIQGKFESSSRLRLPGGIMQKFRSSTPRRQVLPSGGNDNRDLDDDDREVLSSDVAKKRSPPPPGRHTRESSGFDNTIHSESEARTPPRRRSSTKHTGKGSAGIETVSDIQTGHFYSSGGNGRKDSQADGRTMRTNQKKDAKSARIGQAGSAGETVAKADGQMRIAFALQIKCIDIMVVKEDYIFDISPEQFGKTGESGRVSPGNLSREYFSGGEESSSEDMSDLSVLTDDQRFFNEEGHIGVIAEEEEEEGARMSSSDFLMFGLPENPLLRLTVTSLGCSLRGRSGGPLHLGVFVRRIGAVSENESHIFSMGALQPITPVSEVNLVGAQRRKSFDSNDPLDLSSHLIARVDPRFSAREGGSEGGRAISFALITDDSSKDIQCDFSKIGITLDLKPAEKLLKFYSKSEIKYPDKALEKSSHDVARKFMVYKTNAHANSGILNAAIRIHGLEIVIPFSALGSDSSEDSNVDLSNSFEDDNLFLRSGDNGQNCALVLAADSLNFYGGSPVDDICAATTNDMGASRSSFWSGSFASRKGTIVKTLEMLDLVELTAASDSFSSKHWVGTMGGITCHFGTENDSIRKLIDIPIDVEVLATMNEVSLLETDMPKSQIVVEISPAHFLLSEERLNMISATKDTVDLRVLDSQSQLLRKRRKPDPPRIEILSRRILHSVDLNCRRVQLAVVQDVEQEETISTKLKELIMEECLADFLSIVACFDFSLPNEEALSSAMQVCIGRLVGLGLTDDEAWGCTNAGRLNFLDDIALMRRAQTDALVQLSTCIRNGADLSKTPLHEEESEDDECISSNSDSSDFVDESLEDTSHGGEDGPSSTTEGTEDGSDDSDSAKSADIVETTLHNAVEKTVATFAPLLQSYHSDFKDLKLNSILTLDLPLGFRMSIVKLFYDQHLTCLVTSLVITNSAGIELLTLVPHSDDEEPNLDEDQEAFARQGVCFSRYDLDEDYGFGRGGLPMSALAVDDGDDTGVAFRNRARCDDIEVGEVELLFSSKVYEEIIDELSKLGKRKEDDGGSDTELSTSKELSKAGVETSIVITASSVSALFTSDQLVPFSRLTLERMSYRNTKALEKVTSVELPSWALDAESFSLENLTPEGQFYPDTMTLLSPIEDEGDCPFKLWYFKSPDAWEFSSRLDINFTGFRLYLIRQFIHEILQFFVYDRYGVGRLKKKYSTDVRDSSGNQKPPLLYTVRVFDTSIVCPRCSTNSDMVAFEVEEAKIAVSYIPESFQMPTESSPFVPSPGSTPELSRFAGSSRRNSFLSTATEFHDCNEFSDGSQGARDPISSFSKYLKKRLTISLYRVRVFTVISEDKTTRDVVESPLFRFFHEVDGHASDEKAVYARKQSVDRQASISPEALSEVEKYQQHWEEISTDLLNVEVFADSAPHMRLFIGSTQRPFSLDARLSQLCLLLSVWDSNMQEMPAVFPFYPEQVSQSSTPPVIPDDFPGYGTEEFVAHLEDTSSIRSEICCIFKKIALRCTFDSPGHFPVDPGCFQYFDDPRCSDDEKPGLVLVLEDGVVHVVNDFLNVKRIGIGASQLELLDERREAPFQELLATTKARRVEHDSRPPSWADVSWGLRNDIRTLGSSLPLPIQFTVFMTPGWSLINVGADQANGVMHELSWIWVFLDYFKSYYSDIAFGNPGHIAQRWTHKVKNSLRKSNGEKAVVFEPLPGVNVDFRLWLCKPILCIPSDYQSAQAPCLRIESQSGLWYRYKSIRDLSSQEISTTDLNLFFSNEFHAPDLCRRNHARDGIAGVRPLIESLSFGLRYDSNNIHNHKDVSVIIPFMGDDVPDLSVAGEELEVTPAILPEAVICRPVRSLGRSLGSKVCEITCIIEVLPITLKTMMNFFSGPAEPNPEFLIEEEDRGTPTYSVSAKVRDLRLFAIDPVLGVQLPVAVASMASLQLTYTKFTTYPVQLGLKQGEAPPEDMQLTVSSNLWADYFKLGMTRSWEPLLEPFEFLLMYEQARQRGQGFSLEADTPFHLNFSGAFLQILGDTLESFTSLISETFGDKTEQAMRRSVSLVSPSKDRVGALVEDSIQTIGQHSVQVLHEIPKPLKSEDRVAFSLRNLTGQKVRVHQQTDQSAESALNSPAMITYLNQTETMGLTFAATISIVKNLLIVEVPYPGLPNSVRSNQNEGSLTHAVDLQIPGFRWIQGIKVDAFGRSFERLTPRSLDIHAKMIKDWRLRNAIMLLTEVGLDSGGRLVTVRSLFEVRNSTTHPIKLVYDPDPRRHPVEARQDNGEDIFQDNDTILDSSVVSQHFFANAEEIQTIQPGSTFQIPTLLLERSLQMTGSHLGCLWLCPETRDRSLSFWDFFQSNGSSEDDGLEASFCSRPIQLAKLVHESSLIFQNGSGEDIPAEEARSGIQVSCPTRSRKGGVRAPFCYAIEVGRSPLVSINRERSDTDAKEAVQPETPKQTKKKSGAEKKSKNVGDKIHGPVAYSLSIHAPLVVVNLLPEGGRFELMHAIRRTVVWYADLEPGQQVPVHSVGLDAPLLLLVNLGFCRTPVGEGALVHHGVDQVVHRKDQGVRFKSIGKAALKGTKQIGKTLTAMSDSPDRRGQGKIAQINAPQFYNRQNRRDKGNKSRPNVVRNSSLGLDTDTGDIGVAGGKVHKVETIAYSENEIAGDTTVVDGIGQRLTLSIENIRGGGGQRRVSLFCPFWIVNTSEHSLRYKQEKSKTFVSGTVTSPGKDGSKPVDGSNRNYRTHHRAQANRRRVLTTEPQDSENSPMNTQTVFAGTPGALATAPGRCGLQASELTELIDKEVPLERLAKLSFMFNFHEEGLAIGHQMLSVQLHDGTGQLDYGSDWSRGFSLDSVGFSQIISMNTRDGRAMELSAEVNVAPGFLSSYTKIVRFLPRYVVFNRLERPIRLWQDSSVFRPVNEDRTAIADITATSKESRKWRYDFEDKHHREKVNQYEMLYGRPSTIADDRSTGTNIIAEGTTAHRSAQYVATVGPSEIVPFILPDTRAERQLRVDLGGIWNVTSSFASDLPGEHTLKVSRATDLRLLNHVSTRAAPKYKIVLPPPIDSGIEEWDGELGVYFETDWGGDKRIIVKGTKRGRFAYNHTDIHVGDELLRVDGVSVLRMTFAETMKLIKERIAHIKTVQVQLKAETSDQGRRPGRAIRFSRVVVKRRNSGSQLSVEESNLQPAHLTLTFRTLEERMRKVRVKAGRAESSINLTHPGRDSMNLGTSDNQEQTPDLETFNVEMKSIHNTMFVILREQDTDNPAFQIQNRSLHHIIFYRQRGCDGHPWNFLIPGESMPYSWEEPMRSKKLTVRVAAKSQDVFKFNNCERSSQHDSVSDLEAERNIETEIAPTSDTEKHLAQAARLRQALAYQYVNTEERGGFGPSITVRLEEIGYRTFLPVPMKENTRGSQKRQQLLNCEVDTDGGTRLLIVSDDVGAEDDRNVLDNHLETLRKQIAYEEQRVAGLHSLQYLLSKESKDAKEDPCSERVQVIETDARRFVEDFAEDTNITGRHQVVIEVLEAVGLNVSDFISSCNPYCEIFLKGRSKSRQYFYQKRRNKRKTYFIEKSLNPRWTDQTFVFDVPEESVRVTRGHHLLIKVRNFRLFGQHPIIGQAAVHFGSLRNQQALVGWYPLAGRTGRSDVETVQLSDVSRGSIKLRVQWVYTASALIDYFLILSQSRLNQLSKSRDGMTKQLSHAIESDERKREAKGNLNAGRIQKLAKLETRPSKRIPASARKEKRRRDKEKENMVGKRNMGLNTSLAVLKDTLKASRDRYLYALYYQTAESKRSRQIQGERPENAIGHEDSVGESTYVSEQVPVATDPPSSPNDPNDDKQKSTDQFLRSRALIQSPRVGESFQKGNQSLGDFLAKRQSPEEQSPFPHGQARSRLDSGGSPRRLGRRILDTDSGRMLVSHRRRSQDIDEPLGEDESLEQQLNHWQPTLRQGKALYDGLYGQSSELGISDLISVSTDVDEETKRRKNTRVLMSLGFVFHEYGVYFHEHHLPRHFRRSLFASSMEERRANRLYRPRFAVGRASSIHHFKSYQASGALFLDNELDVLVTTGGFLLRFRDTVPTPPVKPTFALESKEIISERLLVPNVAPDSTKNRSRARVETLHLCRTRFERAAKRTVGAALNPGGWLTVRPITALNLPDGYTGMFVRLRYGSDVLVSETVDAKVTPRWGSPEIPDGFRGKPGVRPKRSLSSKKGNDGDSQEFSFTGNDLHVHVEPQQTSGFIKIAVVAERLNNKTELGVLEIPLGSAIAACLDECDGENANLFDQSMYIRWFPLMSPLTATPVEGDMGLSARPKESEQTRDSMFQQYFTPCIQLAFMWWPDGTEDINKTVDTNIKGGALIMQGPSPSVHSHPSEVPAIQSYFNADIGRVSVAIIDSQRAAELLCLTAMDVDLRYLVTKSKTRIGLVVGWIQLDHQDSRSREPVVLAPTPAEGMQPTLQILALKDNLRTKSNIVSYEYIGVALQEMDLTVEESWIFELWDFFMGVMRRRKVKKKTAKGQRRADFLLTTENCFVASDLEESETKSLISILEGAADVSQASRKKMYIEQLILGLVKVNLSYVKGKKHSYELTDKGAQALKNLEVRELPNLALAANGAVFGSLMKGDQSEVFVKWSQHMNDEDLLDSGGYNLPGIIAAVFPSVSDAPIRLQGKVIDHVFESGVEIASSIKNFYENETLKQVYKIIGSLDIVGNPTILFSSFVSGVRDLVAAPTSAFLKSPTNVNQVGIAVGKGTLSLFSHSASGIFGFAAKMSASAGQAAAILSLDAEYRQWHRDRIVTEASNLNRVWKRRGVQSVPEMLTRPVGDILLGVAMGASGLIISPYKGFKKGGSLGLIRGVAIGTAGVVAKPLVGVLDAFTHFSGTVHDIAKSVNVLERRFQPALKLRLPYIFGPMNILSPFDPVAARSVTLLGMFPPKKKGLQRRQKRAKEIHVHSEVLHMEPGVETYAIATTIRVVLIRLKKDHTGSLLPAFGWEVDLGEQGSVTSRVSDHGHNGVALTITRRATGDKGVENAKEGKGWRPKRAQEVIKATPFSSALSVDSGFSDLESDDDDDEVEGDAVSNEDLLRETDVEANEADPDFHHGATKKGDDVLKWYTVLAEYQHRPQLTALHNAVCSLIKNFDAVIADRAHDFDRSKEGVMNFGIFSFERTSQDSRSAYASNVELVAALEHLPWMHEETFTNIQKYPPQKQKELVSALRQNWVFATDLEASKQEGGPAWLVEARARGMFVNAESPSVPDFLHPDDPVVREVMVDFKQGNISSGQATELLYSQKDGFTLSSSDRDEIGHPDSDSGNAFPFSFAEVGQETSSTGDDKILSEAHKERQRARMDSEDELFHSMELNASMVKKDSEDSLQVVGGSNDDTVTPADIASSLDNLEFKSTLAGPAEKKTPPGSVAALSAAVGTESRVQRKTTPHARLDTAPADTRMERMETLMEQIVILNAQQTQRQVPVPTQVPTDNLSEAHSTAESRVAYVLKNELADLRAQVQARAAEDDALKNEIGLLRQQLAERRDQRKEKTTDKAKRKIPEILRFGATSKRQERGSTLIAQSREGTQDAHETNQDLGSFYTTPLKDDSQDLRANGRKPVPFGKIQRRTSGGSSEDPGSLLPRRASLESRDLRVRPSTRRPSGDARLSTKASPRNSEGSEHKPSGRRLSGDQPFRRGNQS